MIHIYIYIQGDNSLLTKRNENILIFEQVVCSQRILNKIQKLRGSEAIKDFFLLIIMSESCSFYPELQESIYQFRQIIEWGWGKGYSALATKLFGGLPPPPLPCSYAYVTESFYGCHGIQETLETLSANGFEKRKKVSRNNLFLYNLDDFYV